MFWSKKFELTEKEQKVFNSIQAMCMDKSSMLDYNFNDASWLLSDSKKQYYIDIDSIGVKITNHAYFDTNHFDSKVLDIFKKTVADEKNKRIKAIKDEIFKNEMSLLDMITENIKQTSNEGEIIEA